MPLRVMCLSNMYPGPGNPDYGAFVETMCDALEALPGPPDAAGGTPLSGAVSVERVVIDTRSRGSLRTPVKYLDLARRAVSRVRDVDVVYAHYLFPTGAIAAAAGRLTGRPWVLTAHGRDVQNLAEPKIRMATAPGLRGAAAVIAVSRYLAGELRASGLRLPPVYVANMGVDMDRFTVGDRAAARARLRLPAAGALVIAVGGLTERKNPLRLLQAFALVRASMPAAQLVYIGDGPLSGAVRAGIDRLGLTGKVNLAGAIPNREVADWMTAADVLALPSLVEPLGIVALEALASGRPVVATRVGGTAEVVGRGGTLVDPRDHRSIAQGILRLLGEPPAPAICRDAAAAHDVRRHAARVATILRAAAAGAPSAAEAFVSG